jgi:hypothetical protein
MIATREDYEDFFASLTLEEAALLAAAGIDRQPDDARILAANCFDIREEDGLPKYLRNGAARVPDPLTATHEAEEIDEPTAPLREDLAEGLRKVFLWILAGLSPRAILQRPRIVANRIAIVGRVLGLNGLGECTHADLAREGSLSRAAYSKLAISFRDVLGNKFLAARGDREHTRAGAKCAAQKGWATRRKKTARP